jgi:hypothetical protein
MWDYFSSMWSVAADWLFHGEYLKAIFVFLCFLPFLRFFVAPLIFKKLSAGPLEAELSYGMLMVGLAVLFFSPIHSYLNFKTFESRVMHYNLKGDEVKYIANLDVIYLGDDVEFNQELQGARAVFKPTKVSREFRKDDLKNLFLFEIEHSDVNYTAACFTKTMDDLENRWCFIN